MSGAKVADDGLAIEVTPEMIEAGRRVFEAWVELAENSEAVVEMPQPEVIDALLSASFAAMALSMPESLRN